MMAVKQNCGEKILIQGTTSMVLAGLVAALKLDGGTLADHKLLFLGAREAGTGIAKLISLEMSKKVVDIKPTVLIGTSGMGRTFTKEVVEVIAAIKEIAETNNFCSFEPHFSV
ncbi:unnamed protein product [Citrullus colocynthis]|uniref:Malic enzyme NAD-binding domain-containing protein n=1 Tax=Citrullus colocynthis TaxID=252529 RepID=A0ABP0ZEP1_9ROSI